jgi:hypothetical protein
MYKPYIDFSFPTLRDSSIPVQPGHNALHLDDHFKRLAMGVPAVVEAGAKGFDHPWRSKIKGREPDTVLFVREMGKEESKGVLVPVKSVSLNALRGNADGGIAGLYT